MGLELHFHEPILSFDRSSSGDEAASHEDEANDTAEESSESGGAGGAVLGALLALAVLVGLAYAVRKRRSGDDDGEAEIEIDE